MSAHEVSAAIESALEHGRALLKVVSANDVGLTGSHQAGFLLPVPHWPFFSPQGPAEAPPILKHPVRVLWPDGRSTDSTVTWYRSKKEFRLTKFGRDFPYRTPDEAGGVLVLVEVEPLAVYKGFVITVDEEIEELQAALGVELIGPSVLFDAATAGAPETEDECLTRRYREVLHQLEDFPTTIEMSDFALQALRDCVQNFAQLDPDRKLMRALTTEYDLFKQIERQICTPEVTRVFASIDDFLKSAQTILQRRKSRAGRSLENHVYSLLAEANIPFERQARLESSTVDALIPGKVQYFDANYSRAKLLAVAIKTTCKDRWRQILPEATRVPTRHLITVQKGISDAQVNQMVKEKVQLVVPKELHSEYSKVSRPKLLTVEGFLEKARIATR